MPKSKNRRKNRSAQQKKVRKANASKAESLTRPQMPSAQMPAPTHEHPSSTGNIFSQNLGIRPYGHSLGWTKEPEYQVESYWKDEDYIPEDDQSVQFEMTEAHFRNTEIGKVDFMGEIGGG